MPAWLVAVTYLAASAGGIAGKVVADPAGYAVTGILIADVGATRGLATMIAAGAVITLVIPFLGPVRRLQAAHPPPGAANP